MSKLIALIGKSGAGKTTVADMLASELRVQRLRTGEVCRKIAQLLFGSDSKDNTQLLDDALTQIDSAIFVKAILRDKTLWSNGCVLDSLRFKADFDEVKKLGFVTIAVSASRQLRNSRLIQRGQEFSAISENHRGEMELSAAMADYEIINESTLPELKDSVGRILREIYSD
jgi:dephospho-CoA kinase